MGIPLVSRVEEFVKNRDNPCHLRKITVPLCFFVRGGGRRNVQRVFLGFAFALLSLALPNASAQPFASRDLAKEFETSGYGLPNKNPSGVWMDENRKVMLVLDHKSERIYSYSMDTDPPTRLDYHHNEGTNTDDFLLEIPDNLRPYGIWANGKNNGSTLWVSYFRTDDDVDETGKIRAYTLTWTNSTKTLPEGAWNKYATGTRITGTDNNGETTYPKDVTVVPGTRKPHGIWANDEFMYVADNGKWRI